MALPTSPTPPPSEPPEGSGNQQSSPAGYTRVGQIDSARLLDGNPDQFIAIDSIVVAIRSWLQDHLTRNGRADDIDAARRDPSRRERMIRELDSLILQYLGKNPIPTWADRRIVIASVINEIVGLGPIEPLWSDPSITEVMVNGPNTVYVEISGKLRRAPGARFRDATHLLDVCQQILAPLNRSVDQKQPLADGRLPDGSRVHIVHPALAPTGPLLTIRRFPDKAWTLIDLVDNGSVSEEIACELAFLIHHRTSTVVVGGTGSGKTSLLNALSSCIDPAERVVTVEDAMELRLHPQAHVAALEARPAAADGKGEIRIRDLVRTSLRMRPDRIVVGEVRDGAALDMLQAMNTGHEGSLTTIHANGDADAVINRISMLVAQAGEVPVSQVEWLISDAVDLLVMQDKSHDGKRRIQAIYELLPIRSTGGKLTPVPLWTWEHETTDTNGVFHGKYVRHNELSEHQQRRLSMFPRFTLDDVRRMSAFLTNPPDGSR